MSDTYKGLHLEDIVEGVNYQLGFDSDDVRTTEVLFKDGKVVELEAIEGHERFNVSNKDAMLDADQVALAIWLAKELNGWNDKELAGAFEVSPSSIGRWRKSGRIKRGQWQRLMNLTMTGDVSEGKCRQYQIGENK